MKEVLQALASFFAYAVMAVFAQNAVFTRALGVSRVVKLVDMKSEGEHDMSRMKQVMIRMKNDAASM